MLHSSRDMQRSCRFVSSGYLCSLTYSIKRSHAKVLLVCELYGERIHALVMVNDRLCSKSPYFYKLDPVALAIQGAPCVYQQLKLTDYPHLTSDYSAAKEYQHPKSPQSESLHLLEICCHRLLFLDAARTIPSPPCESRCGPCGQDTRAQNPVGPCSSLLQVLLLSPDRLTPAASHLATCISAPPPLALSHAMQTLQLCGAHQPLGTLVTTRGRSFHGLSPQASSSVPDHCFYGSHPSQRQQPPGLQRSCLDGFFVLKQSTRVLRQFKSGMLFQ